MSAMPERVWVSIEQDGVLYAWYEEGIAGDVPYVPESRLLAAEARVREVEAERDAIGGEVGAGLYSGALHLLICNGDHNLPLWDVKPGVLCNCPIGKHFKELHRENATLRADRDALVELVRDVACSGVAFEDKRLDYVEIQIDTDTWAQARAILAREAGE